MIYKDYRCNPRRVLALVFVTLLSVRCSAEERLVEVTVFELADGTRIESISFSIIATESGGPTYAIRSCDGDRTRVPERDVVKRSIRKAKVSELPEDAQQCLLRSREAAERVRQATEVAPVIPALPGAKARKRNIEAKLRELADTRDALTAELNQKLLLMAEAVATYQSGIAVLTSSGAMYTSGQLEKVRRQCIDSARKKEVLEQANKELRDQIFSTKEEIRKTQGELQTADAEIAALLAAPPAPSGPAAAEVKPDALAIPALVNAKTTKVALKNQQTIEAVSIEPRPGNRVDVKDADGKVHHLTADEIENPDALVKRPTKKEEIVDE